MTKEEVEQLLDNALTPIKEELDVISNDVRKVRGRLEKVIYLLDRMEHKAKPRLQIFSEPM